jgi:hypothetical protein
LVTSGDDMSGKRCDPSRPYNDQNPIIDMTPPPGMMRLSPGVQERRGSALRSMYLTAALMAEQNGECYWCGHLMWRPRVQSMLPLEHRDAESRATFDHKLPKSRGGKMTKENGVAACLSCNNHRGDTPFEDYEQWPPESYAT